MALGRGLSELLGEVEAAYENNTGNENIIKNILLDQIEPNPYQPRKIFDNEKLEELSQSIIAHGLLQPIVVIKKLNSYMLVSGERRLRASKMAKLKNIRAIVLNIDEKKLREYALIENIQRDDLNILEIANSYAGLINEYGVTHDELSNMVFKSRSSITNILRLLTLSKYSQDAILKNKITKGHAKLIVGLSEDEQTYIVDSIVGQKLSVRETEILLKSIKEKTIFINNAKTKEFNDFVLDVKKIEPIVSLLNHYNLEVKVSKNNIKININSDKDIENILTYFSKIK